MIYREPGVLAVSKIDRLHTGKLKKRENLLAGVRGEAGGGGGAKPYDSAKAWSSINHSIHADFMYQSHETELKGLIILQKIRMCT
jgi:hypothetical protein